MDGNFSNKIFFSDEAYFTLDGYVKKQNCHIWGAENYQIIEERPLHPEKLTVWCVLWSEGVIDAGTAQYVSNNQCSQYFAWGGHLNDMVFHT